MTSFRFAGLGDVTRVGLSVRLAVDRLLRFAYVERRLMFLAAAHLGPVPERDLKLLLGRLQYDAGERCRGLRERLHQMRTPKSRIEKKPDEQLEILMDEAFRSESSREIAETIWWLHRELHATYEYYLRTTNPLADAPTCDVIEAGLPSLSSAIDCLDHYLNHLGADAPSRGAGEGWKSFCFLQEAWMGPAQNPRSSPSGNDRSGRSGCRERPAAMRPSSVYGIM